MLVDLLCASASIEPVRRDLELMNDVQHCRNLVAPRCVELMLLCWSSSLLRCSASACISIAFLISGCFVDNPDSSLSESILLFSSKIDSGARTPKICSSIHSGVSFVCVYPSLLMLSMLQIVSRGFPSCVDFFECSSPNPSVDVFPRILTGSPENSDWFS